MFSILVTTLTAVVGVQIVLWLISLRIRDVSIVDIFWGSGFIIVAWVCFALNVTSRSGESASYDWRLLLMSLMLTTWGTRLSLYLFWRNHGKPEDSRYAAMRDKHGANFWWVSLFTVFLLQAVIMWFVSLPVQVVAAVSATPGWSWLDGLGVGLWAVGLFFETMGDWQLARFKSDPANQGKVLDRGLWRYTRHPNYFGDFCVWWGIYFVSITGGGGWMIFSPMVMSFLLMRVSGVVMTEKTILQRRPEYETYKQKTNAFFPWWPREMEAS